MSNLQLATSKGKEATLTKEPPAWATREEATPLEYKQAEEA